MAVTLSFKAGEGATINDLAGSGLGFYGANFGTSVRVGEYQERTFITDSAGTAQGPEADNVKYLSSGSGILGQSGSGVPLTAIPNQQATLNIRATSDASVQIQSATVYIYDRVSINNGPSGVTCMAAEIIHPDPVQNNNGSGDTAWIQPVGSSLTLTLAPSPGLSGEYAGNGSNSVRPDTIHDWYVALSASPDSIGSKTNFALHAEVEYL